MPPFVVTVYPDGVPATIVDELAGDTANAVTSAPAGPTGLHELVAASRRGVAAVKARTARPARIAETTSARAGRNVVCFN